jgi:hypothetical protein
MAVAKKNDSIVAVVGTRIEAEEIVKELRTRDGSKPTCAAAGHPKPRRRRQAYERGFPGTEMSADLDRRSKERRISRKYASDTTGLNG